MTCLVAVMNARGIALAADSAVTLGDERKKIYHTAEKLFLISPDIPVAIMTFGSADMMGIPWETVVKGFAKRLGPRQFDTLEQYAANFFSFVEGSAALFPPERQSEFVKRVVWSLWAQYRSEFEEQRSSRPKITAAGMKAFAELVRVDLQKFDNDPMIESLGADYGASVLKTYADQISEVEADLFADFELDGKTRDNLRKSVAQLFARRCWGPYMSGVVIAGMGEEEPFPTVLEYSVGTLAAGRLRYAKTDEGRVDVDCIAMVMPFAQRETIDMIISGIHPDIRTMMMEQIQQLSPRLKKGDASNGEDGDIRGRIRSYLVERYEDPFMTAVSALPRQDLAKMAEALVSLTAFVMRMSADQDETVAEPIDVAVLSKSDGFTWIKHKDLVGKSARLG